MIRKTIPVLVHEDCMDSISVGLAKQEAKIAKISANTAATNTALDGIVTDVEEINTNTTSIKTSSANAATQLGTIKEDTGSLISSVGLPEDAASTNTVIGLLKSISNRITTF